MLTSFTMLVNDGQHITSEMPADETVVEVVLINGPIVRAWYSQHIMEVGDWDFVALNPGEDEPGDEAASISHLVAGWRKLAA